MDIITQLRIKAIGLLYDGGINTYDIANILNEDIVYVNNKTDIHRAKKKLPPNVTSCVERPGWVQVVPHDTHWPTIAFLLYGYSLAKCTKEETKELRSMFPEMEKILQNNLRINN